MNACNVDTEKRFTIEESIIQASKEVCLMREGKLPKNSIKDLFNKIEEWKNEDTPY